MPGESILVAEIESVKANQHLLIDPFPAPARTGAEVTVPDVLHVRRMAQ